MKILPLFEEYQKLEEQIPRVSLGDFPTPVRRLRRLGEHVGVSELYVKDDGCSSKLYGGNKVRKLEFLLAEALERKADMVITVGAAGSNHVLATTIFARHLGMKTVAVLFDQPKAIYVRRNLLLDLYFGAKLTYSPSVRMLPLLVAFQRIIRRLEGKPYYIPVGGSVSLGCLGFVNAGFELKQQVDAGVLPEPDYIFVAAGSLGTVAGLYLGCKLSSLKTKVVGVKVTERNMCSAYRWADLVNRTSELLCQIDHSIPKVKISPSNVLLLNKYIGRGYAWFTEEGMKAASLIRRLEGLMLEGTYTAKTLAGALDYLEKNRLKDKVILFWNTHNSVDLSHLAKKVSFKDLPKPFHKYFEGSAQKLDFEE